jgi:hypothetical protein
MDVGDVLFCPGDNSHYKLVWRKGMQDVVIRHKDVALQESNKTCTTLGGGRVAVPVKLQPGATWTAEFSLRKHYQHWPPTDFDRRREEEVVERAHTDEDLFTGHKMGYPLPDHVQPRYSTRRPPKIKDPKKREATIFKVLHTS